MKRTGQILESGDRLHVQNLVVDEGKEAGEKKGQM